MSYIHFNTLESNSCDCCVIPHAEENKTSEPYGCAEKKAIFTQREQRVLKSIRETAVRARELKSRINNLKHSDSEKERVETREAFRELETLRELRLDLEKERVAAAHERMVLLGHA